MVNIQHISLSIFLVLALFSTGCAMNPLQSPAPAPVEEHGRSEKPSAQVENKITQPSGTEAEPVAVPTPLPEPAPVKNEALSLSAENQGTGKSGAAVVALLDNADRDTEAGRRDQAIASLERALRIEPKNPIPWHKLSRLRLEEKNWKQAVALAKKSNVLAPGNKVLQAENWKIIAQASAAMGDATGAARAWEMVRQLEQ
jgi:tetratricopeptide (TPR) repeat protein